MPKLNCWEFKGCGREPDGAKAKDLGVCPAATEDRTNGINSGQNGGRACWALTGTMCGGSVQGTYAMKLVNCMDCDFYRLVGSEEGPAHVSAKGILVKLQ
jgi:hypothetical protein